MRVHRNPVRKKFQSNLDACVSVGTVALRGSARFLGSVVPRLVRVRPTLAVLPILIRMIRFRRDEFACKKSHMLTAHADRRDKIAGNAPSSGGANTFESDTGAAPSLFNASIC